uniref:GM07606p n=1 Tax=Drosophila melanogaster TaxID=7227 RepID=Q95S68_DROME|nr:GM07606p [Drosophila melanogaster]
MKRKMYLPFWKGHSFKVGKAYCIVSRLTKYLKYLRTTKKDHNDQIDLLFFFLSECFIFIYVSDKSSFAYLIF